MSKGILNKLLYSSLLTSLTVLSFNVSAGDGYWEDRWEDKQRERRQEVRHDVWHARHRPNYVVVPRHRTVNNIVVVRPYGHPYPGYGHYHNDNDAVKWLAFTAITLKVLDNINEAAQRAHEAAQIKATTAPVGEKVVWTEGDSSGYVVATREGKSSETGLTCREYQQSITVGGKTEEAYGTACLQADGSWKIVN